MKKGKKFLMVYLVVISGLLIVFSLIQLFLPYIGGNAMTKIVSQVITYLAILMGLGGISVVIVFVVTVLKSGMHNLSKCDDPLFDRIDSYKRHWEERNENYLKQIKVINYYYRENGEVDQLITEKEILKLFQRKDFLMNQRGMFSELSVYIGSLAISLIAAFFIQIVGNTNVMIAIAGAIIIVVLFFATVLWKYTQRGELGSYYHLINEYEIDCLDEKIKRLKNDMVIPPKSEMGLETQQCVLGILIDKRLKAIRKKERKKLEEDIERIEKLDLCIDVSSGCYIRKINIMKKEIKLIYDINLGKATNYIGEVGLKTADYSILYSILKKYDLI